MKTEKKITISVRLITGLIMSALMACILLGYLFLSLFFYLEKLAVQ